MWALKSKWVRRSAIILTTVVVACAGLVLFLNIFGGTTVQKAVSSDGRFIAEVVVDDVGGATEPPYVSVEIRKRYLPLRDWVFYAAGDGNQLHISWKDPSTLLVICDCNDMRVYLMDHSWHSVAIEYRKQGAD